MKKAIITTAAMFVLLLPAWVGPWPEHEIAIHEARARVATGFNSLALKVLEDVMNQRLKEYKRRARVTITAYHPVAAQCNSDPWHTASGRISVPGTTLAVSRDLKKDLGLKWGDLAIVPGHGVMIVQDLMAKRWKKRVDVMVPIGKPGFKKTGEVIFIRSRF